MVLKIQDLIDIEQFQLLQDRLNEIYSFPSAIVDNEGKILTATAWQDVCTKFHRQNSESEKECIKSDKYIEDHLHEANPAVSYRCPHGLIDNATPIIIEGVHYGNFFTGQFFLEPPDLNFFRAQAKRYGFDEEGYIEAVKKAPIWTQEQLNSYLFFIKGLIEVIAGVGLKTIKEIESGKRIRETKEWHRTILRTAMDGFWLADLQERLLEVNETYCQMSGYSEQELLSMSIPDLELVENSDDTTAHMQKIITHGVDRFESMHRRKDGSTFDVEVSVQYRPTDGGQMVAFLRDITDRKEAENTLRESEEKYRILFDNDRAAIYIFEVENSRFLDVNEAFIRLYGYSRDELLGNMTALDTSAEPEESAKSFRVAETGTIFIPLRWHKKKDGTIFPVEIIGGIYIWKGQRVMFGMSMDISERRRIEEERIAMERKLLHSQKLESLGVLAGGIAHDFNNLLMTILGNMELAMDDISPVSPARPYLENAHTASKRAADLTRQMLAYSGKGKFVIENMNLSELVQENIRILRASIPATINLGIQLNSDMPPIMADAGQIQQVVMNLLTNAAEAIGDRAGTITLTTGVKHCDEKYLKSSRLHEKPAPGEFVYLEVVDTGCGMDEATQQKIFDPFFTTKFTGRGLGMSAMQGIILGHKGAIFVNSEVGKGTTVRVNFPVSDSVAEIRAVISPTREISSSSDVSSPHNTILIVDDEEDVRQICSTMVSRLGYRILTAADGEEAVASFRDHADEIVCIILDMTMPKMDGYATFQSLKEIRPDVKAILSSGYNQEAITQRFTGLGLAGFIQKPYRRQQLQDELERVLKQG